MDDYDAQETVYQADLVDYAGLTQEEKERYYDPAIDNSGSEDDEPCSALDVAIAHCKEKYPKE